MSLSPLRSGMSLYGTKASDDVNEAIRIGWSAQTVALYEKRLKAGDAAFQRRRRIAANVNQILCGEFEDLVKNLLASRYDQDVFKQLALDSGISQRLNVMRDVLDKCDVTVSEGCDYSLVNARKEDAAGDVEKDAASEELDDDEAGETAQDEEDEESNPAFENMIRAMDMDGLLQRVSRLCWVHPAVLVMPRVVWSDRVGKRVLEMCVLTPDRFDLVSLDDGSALWDVLVVYDDDGDERTLYSSGGYAEQRWDRNSGRWVTEEVGPNPYGAVQGVVFKPTKSQLWWHENYGVQLAESTISANAAETFIDFLMSGQVKVPMGSLDGFPKGQFLRHAQPINVGGDGKSVALMDFQLDIKGLVDLYVTRERTQAAQAVGLSGAEWDFASTPPSGSAMQMKFWARDRLAMARRGWLVERARELYWLTMRVLYVELTAPLPGVQELEGGTEQSITQVWPIECFDGGWVPATDGSYNWSPPAPSDVLPPYEPNTSPDQQPYQPLIDPRDTSYPMSISDQIADETYSLSMGYATRADFLRGRNPDLTAAQAKALIPENLAIEAAYRQRYPSLSPNGAPPEPAPPADVMAGAQDDRALQMGLKSVVDLMLEKNPGMSVDDAMQAIQQNKRINASVLGPRSMLPVRPSIPGGVK